MHVMYTLPEADFVGGVCTSTLSRRSYTYGAHGHIIARARIHAYVWTRCDSYGEPGALCCARGHDNSAEKPRNICPAAINSETAPTFLANLHKTVTYHSIIRPIRPCRPFARLTSPGSSALSRAPIHPFSPSALCRQVVRIVFYLPFFFRALHFPQFPTNPLDVTGMRGRKRTLCDRVTRYGAANSTLACFRPNYNILYLRTINFHFSFPSSLTFSLSLPIFFLFFCKRHALFNSHVSV